MTGWLPAMLVCAALTAAADDRWNQLRSGPFEILFTSERAAQDTLNFLEQYRHTLGTACAAELTTVWPVRIVVFESAKQLKPYAGAEYLKLGGDAYTAALAAGAVPREFLVRLGERLLEDGAPRIAAPIERGLIEFFSTLQVAGTRVTAGAPPEKRTRDWARMHLLMADPRFSGKVRVLTSNLQKGVPEDPAYRNAFALSPAEIEKETDAYIAAAQFETVQLNARPINPRRDFQPRPVDAGRAREILAELRGETPAAAGTRGLLVQAASEKDAAKARAILEKAAEANPRWAEPHARMAALEQDLGRKIPLLSKAAQLAPRNASYWRALAEAQMSGNLYADASKSWAAAEHAAATAEERAAIRQARAGVVEKRVEYEEQERRRIAEERERELNRLKDEALERIRAAEARASKGKAPRDPSAKVEEWWEGPKPAGTVRGVLQRADCLGKLLRLVIRGDDGKTIQLAVRDPNQVVIEGGGQLTLGCGPLKPPRKVVVDYFGKPDTKLATAGDAGRIEFR